MSKTEKTFVLNGTKVEIIKRGFRDYVAVINGEVIESTRGHHWAWSKMKARKLVQ